MADVITVAIYAAFAVLGLLFAIGAVVKFREYAREQIEKDRARDAARDA